MNKRTATQLITRWLIYLNIVFWFGFSLITAFGFHPGIPEGPIYRWVMASLSFLTGLGILGTFLLMTRGMKAAYYLLLAGILLIAVMSITDEVGFSDLLVLAINLGIFILLIRDRKIYLRQ
jgi:hypothetical protein